MKASKSNDTQTATGYLAPPGTETETPGTSATYDLGQLAGKQVLLVVKIDGAIEQEFLHVSVWGSADGQDWGAKPLFWFPQLFEPGAKPAALDLKERPEIKFLQARWEVKRWGRGYPRPYFKFSLEIQPLEAGPTGQ